MLDFNGTHWETHLRFSHCRGNRFKSGRLHQIKKELLCSSFFIWCFILMRVETLMVSPSNSSFLPISVLFGAESLRIHFKFGAETYKLSFRIFYLRIILRISLKTTFSREFLDKVTTFSRDFYFFGTNWKQKSPHLRAFLFRNYLSLFPSSNALPTASPRTTYL